MLPSIPSTSDMAPGYFDELPSEAKNAKEVLLPANDHHDAFPLTASLRATTRTKTPGV